MPIDNSLTNKKSKAQVIAMIFVKQWLIVILSLVVTLVLHL